ncbi:MAG: DUF11 domain-containing protein, partial [Halobacteriota archaeon]
MKRRILVLCLLLALVFMATAAPADATDITLGKNVNGTVNRFCVGNTINYNMLVGNPAFSTDNMTLNVYDTYPNGTIELLEADLFLAPGDYKRYYRPYVVKTGDAGTTITNHFWVNGTSGAGEAVEGHMDKNSLILDPGISITKVAAPTSGAPYTNVTFTINITNTGDCTLDPVKVVDTLPGGMSYVSDDFGGIEGPVGTITWSLGSMGSGALTTIHLVAHIDVGPAGTLTNNVLATGTPKDSMCNDVTDSDTADVTRLFNPDIRIVKTASLTGTCPGSDPLAVDVGDTVTYCFNVTNTGDVNLTGVKVNDNIYGSVTLATTTLAPGDSTLGSLTHVVVESDA